MNTVIKCTSFITFTYFDQNVSDKKNHMERFMNDEKHPIHPNDFIKYLKKIGENITNEDYPSIINEIINDYAISNVLYEKFVSFFNLFFSQK
jgi:Ca2+-binding EF-hand superfamily protein